VTIPLVSASDNRAEGSITFLYKGLRMNLKSKDQTAWGKIKTGLINFVANDIVVPDNNPSLKGITRTGVIYFERDKEKGFINFVWKSILSGLKSQMGFNSDEQKQTKKKVAREQWNEKVQELKKLSVSLKEKLAPNVGKKEKKREKNTANKKERKNNKKSR
jgi:hypothetical protein